MVLFLHFDWMIVGQRRGFNGYIFVDTFLYHLLIHWLFLHWFFICFLLFHFLIPSDNGKFDIIWVHFSLSSFHFLFALSHSFQCQLFMVRFLFLLFPLPSLLPFICVNGPLVP